MKTTNSEQTQKKLITLDGELTISKLSTGQHAFDFMCCENVLVEPFNGTCKVQMMHDGNVYIIEKRKRVKNKPIFREDNASLSHGNDGRWYFTFSLDDSQLKKLPKKLQQQATSIAKKVATQLINKEGE